MKNYLKNLLFRLLILVIIIVILLLGLEFILSMSKQRKEHVEWIQEDILINKMNKDKLQNKEWATNPLWIHEGETLSEKKDDIKRILIIGDSYIWGDGYSNANHLWWQQFRLKLKQNGYNNVEVIAAGLGGYSTKQEFENIIKNKDLMMTINPDLIIFGYVSNDPEFRTKEGKTYIKAINNEDLFYDTYNPFIKKYKKIFPYTYNSLSLLLSNKFKDNIVFQNYFGTDYYTFINDLSSGEWLKKYENEVIIPLKKYMDVNFNIPYFFYITSREKEPGFDNITSVFKNNGLIYYTAFNDNTKNEENIKINPANYHPSVSLCNNFAETLFKIVENNYKDILGDKGIYKPIININDWMPFNLNVKKVKENKYTLIYPSLHNKDSFLNLPIKQNYVKLNLEEPIVLKKIFITSNNIEKIELFVNRIDENLGYDTQEFISIGLKHNNFYWELDNSALITSINISAETCNGKQAELTITLE